MRFNDAFNRDGRGASVGVVAAVNVFADDKAIGRCLPGTGHPASCPCASQKLHGGWQNRFAEGIEALAHGLVLPTG